MGDTLKRAIGMGLSASLVTITALIAREHIPPENVEINNSYSCIETEAIEDITILHGTDYMEEQEEIRNEIMYGEIELLAQLIEAEAGNQDETGKRYVADVVMNRVESPCFPDTVEKVIYQKNPVQFSVTEDGAFDKAGWSISNDSFKVAMEEYFGARLNTEIMYFRTDRYSDSGKPAFIYGNHYFSTK